VLTSIIIPACNEERFLDGLLSGLREYVRDPVEIIVVDNGSTDGTARIATAHGVTLLQLGARRYPSVVRNEGARHARAQILTFLDADVEITPAWAAEFARLLRRPGLSASPFVTGDQYHTSKSGSWIERYWFEPLRTRPKTYINGGNLITSRMLFDSLGGFRDDLETGEDVDFCLRARAAGASVTFNPGLVALHEGFPKTLSDFIRRERWHGKGDFQSLALTMASRPALLTLIFLTMHILLLGFALAGASFAPAVAMLVVAIAGLCFASAWARFRDSGAKYVLAGTAMNYLYFTGRAQSLYLVLKDRLVRSHP
jgi:glycosyltransferase involved in cell wall biosynthesis